MAGEVPEVLGEEAAPAKIHVARLVAGVYQGIEEIDAGAKTDEHVEVPQDCDLKAGNYRWDGHEFVPLAVPLPADSQRLLFSEKALYFLVRALQQQNLTVPSYTAEWADWYASTIDVR